MLKVLINAYACSPNMGSEPGMAWNWCVNLAKYCELEIITEGEFRDRIEAVLPTIPQGKNMHFHYNPVSDKVRQMCWNQGDWRFYWYYRKWQKRTNEIALNIIAQNHIDVIHQMNMVGFREPGYLWKIKNIPFVWGPIGGMELMPTAFLDGASFEQKMKTYIKNAINDFQRKHQPRVVRAINQSDALIAATKSAYDILHDYHHKEVVLINETGSSNIAISVRPHNEKFKILWVGRIIYTKQLNLAIEAIAATQNKNIELHICGDGDVSYVQQLKELAKIRNVSSQCIWHGNVAHDEIFHMMSESDLFLFTSVLESTSTVVLEAISVGLPILSFYACGFGPLVKKFAGIAIDMVDSKNAINEFANKINYFFHNPDALNKISEAELVNRHSLSWEEKAKEMMKIYNKVVNASHNLGGGTTVSNCKIVSITSCQNNKKYA
jgi:glycosyltransferase involved in cell wall biosynthesis